jgi:two-component sensor histidine kinase/AmiR/NasT family two-component response regulator
MSKPRILVVEDDKIITLEITERLKTFGYEVAGVASDGETALELTRKLNPDLILMDINLKGSIDGITVAEKVKEDLQIPIIYLTAYADSAIIERAKITEPYGYIVKPLDERELHSSIEIALYKHKMESMVIDERNRYKSIVEGYDVLIYIINSDMIIDYMNKQLIKVTTKNGTGDKCYKAIYGLSEPCSWCTVDQIALGQHTRIEVHNVETNKWFYEVATPTYSKNIITGQQRIIIDITDKKLAEKKMIESVEEKELMLKEIHHRVKNNLQIMLSLVRLQGRSSISSVSSKELLLSFENRIMSMTLIHELLYNSSDIKKISFEDYIKKLTINLLKVYIIESERVNIEVKIKDILLSVDSLIPCGMIINELVSNSLKHGFPENRKGKIVVEMIQFDNYFKLTVSDNGIGYPENKSVIKENSLGIQIIKMLSAQMGGNPEFKNANGAMFSILFKDTVYKERLPDL